MKTEVGSLKSVAGSSSEFKSCLFLHLCSIVNWKNNFLSVVSYFIIIIIMSLVSYY